MNLLPKYNFNRLFFCILNRSGSSIIRATVYNGNDSNEGNAMNTSNDAKCLEEILSGLAKGDAMTQSERVLRVAYRYYLKNSKALTHGTWDNRSAKVCARAIFPKVVTGLVNEGYIIWSKSRCGSTVHYFLTEEGMNKGCKLNNNI